MGGPTAACPRGHAGDGYRVRKDGWATTKSGRRPFLRCISATGEAHRFLGPPVDNQEPDGRRTAYAVFCPQPGHKDALIQSRGVRTTKTGTWRRFVCTRPSGDTHSFRVMVTEGTLASPVATPAPPACPEHPASKVVRAGTYGKHNPRQRYLCRPEDGKPHQFTPPLARETVSPGDSCTRCDELLSPHHGPLTAARSTTWPLPGIAQALNDLSLGESYANVSLALRAQRDAARDHLKTEHGVVAFTRRSATTVTSTTSHSRRQRRNAWRVAADLVEQYSPPMFAEVAARYEAEAQVLREGNDAALAADPGASLELPLVYVLDELTIWTTATQGKPKRPEWNVLTVAEVRWKPSGDPFLLAQRDTRLRLARAFPRANADAWKLVLDELGVRPDFVVADKGSGLNAALASYYGPAVGVVPSLWHLYNNVRDALLELDNTTWLDGKERVLIDPLRKHLSLLAREELIGRTDADIKSWWDELEAIVIGLPAPVSSVKAERALHEPRLLAALPILNANPQVPASNAAVENRIRLALKPFLVNRAHLFGNQERTNRLLNLLVCRDAGVFTNLDDLTLRIRQMNESTGGWAPAPRQILDKQPPATTNRTRRYASLKAHGVITRLAKDKGITTTAQAKAAAPIPKFAQKRPETIATAPIRDWARSLGLPMGVNGPIRASVRAAYEAAQAGATDDEAKAAYEQAEAERLEANDKAKKGKWRGAAEKARRAELAPIRAWAKENGIDLPRNNLMPPDVVAAYKEAQKGAAVKRRPSRRPKKASDK